MTSLLVKILSAFDFQINYRPGSLNGRVDALSRRVDLIEVQGQEEWRLLRLAALESYQPIWIDDCILKRLKVAIEEDQILQPMLKFFKEKLHQVSMNTPSIHFE